MLYDTCFEMNSLPPLLSILLLFMNYYFSIPIFFPHTLPQTLFHSILPFCCILLPTHLSLFFCSIFFLSFSLFSFLFFFSLSTSEYSTLFSILPLFQTLPLPNPALSYIMSPVFTFVTSLFSQTFTTSLRNSFPPLAFLTYPF